MSCGKHRTKESDRKHLQYSFILTMIKPVTFDNDKGFSFIPDRKNRSYTTGLTAAEAEANRHHGGMQDK